MFVFYDYLSKNYYKLITVQYCIAMKLKDAYSLEGML